MYKRTQKCLVSRKFTKVIPPNSGFPLTVTEQIRPLQEVIFVRKRWNVGRINNSKASKNINPFHRLLVWTSVEESGRRLSQLLNSQLFTGKLANAILKKKDFIVHRIENFFYKWIETYWSYECKRTPQSVKISALTQEAIGAE